MSVQQLTSEHFQLFGNTKKVLKIASPNPILILFKIQNCQGCSIFEPQFLKLAQIKRNIGFAVVDLTIYRDIIDKSRQTTSPINKVPDLVLYSGGIPRMRYTGKKNIQDIIFFLDEYINNNPPQQARQQPFMASSQQSQFQQQPQFQQQQPFQQQPQFQQQQPFQQPYQQQVPQHQTSQYQQMGSMQGNTKTYQPEIGREPAMGGIIKGYDPSAADGFDYEADTKLSIPEQVTPHNTPWGTEYQ